MPRIEQLLEDIDVLCPGMWENENSNGSLKDWWAVSAESHGGIVAYFQYESDAYRFRMDLINQILNPVVNQYTDDYRF